MEMTDTASTNEELLPWHKPEVQRLTVTLDTGFGRLSATDGVQQDPGDFPVPG